MVKILMTWDIKPGREQEYFEFMVREWVPGIQRLGIEPTDAWYTQHGNSPQILSGGTARDLNAMRQILATDDWASLKGQLLGFVDNYQERLVRARSGFQML
ncbi:MAG TPA: hypothetical protein PK954_03905 [Anaerolineales bacterium]|nr:hypothetical protein [Anaerolineales bacterium]HRF47905.1 hypothetical protein [Anaerolineales bacterium]